MEHFEFGHHMATEEIIYVRTENGPGIADLILAYGVDTNRLAATVAGKDDCCDGFFAVLLDFATIVPILAWNITTQCSRTFS